MAWVIASAGQSLDLLPATQPQAPVGCAEAAAFISMTLKGLGEKGLPA